MRQTLLIVVLCMSAIASAQTLPATQPGQPAQENLPVVRLERIEQAVRFSVEDDMLVARTSLSPIDGEVRAVVPGLAGVARLRAFDLPAVNDHSTGRNFSFILEEIGAADANHRITHVSGTAGRLIVARDSESGEVRYSVQLIQDPPADPLAASAGPADEALGPVRLLVTRASSAGVEPQVSLKLYAGTFTELRRMHPGEVETHLRPIFRDLKQDGAVFALNERVAWQVLGHGRAPDADLRGRIDAALAKFDADDFRQRDAAAAELAALGQPAAQALLAADRGKYSPAQNAGIDAFLAQYQDLPPADVQRLRASPQFLLDTLASENAELRRLAWEELRKTAKDLPPFDPEADAQTRARQLEALRAALPPSTAPAR